MAPHRDEPGRGGFIINQRPGVCHHGGRIGVFRNHWFMFGLKAAADFGKTLVNAGAIKPAIGICLILTGLVAIVIASWFNPSQLVFWPPLILAILLFAVGLWPIVSFFRDQVVTPKSDPVPGSPPKPKKIVRAKKPADE